MWANEDTWNAEIQQAARDFSVPATLIKAIIGQESQFNPSAYRAEVAVNDASRGLMQILYATARGEGYVGTADGLFDPYTNIHYGTSYLAGQLARASGSVRGGVSAYNGGWNPSVGFGAPVTKAGVTVCLARDKTGKCVQSRTVPVGEYANQDYVNKVLRNLAYFEAKERTPPTVVASSPGYTPPLSVGQQPTNESQIAGRISGTPTRSHGSSIRTWAAVAQYIVTRVVEWFKSLLRKQR